MNASLEWCDTDMTMDLGAPLPFPRGEGRVLCRYNTAPAIGCDGWWCGIFRRAKWASPASPASHASPAWPA